MKMRIRVHYFSAGDFVP